MLTREESILNLLKRAIFYAANGAVQIKDISFSEKTEQFLIDHFEIYLDYARTETKSKEESAYRATKKMAFYLHDLLGTFDNVMTTNSRIAFLKKWNEFLFVDCIKLEYLTGLSEVEAKLVMNNALSKEEQYDLYQFVLFENPSTTALKEEIRNRVSAKAICSAGLRNSTQSQHADPNDFRLS